MEREGTRNMIFLLLSLTQQERKVSKQNTQNKINTMFCQEINHNCPAPGILKSHAHWQIKSFHYLLMASNIQRCGPAKRQVEIKFCIYNARVVGYVMARAWNYLFLILITCTDCCCWILNSLDFFFPPFRSETVCTVQVYFRLWIVISCCFSVWILYFKIDNFSSKLQVPLKHWKTTFSNLLTISKLLNWDRA